VASSPRSARTAKRRPPRLLGSEEPRLWTAPLRPLTPRTSLGFEAIEFAETVLGVTLLPWQKWLLIHALELLPDGSFRFRTLVILVARQNGKTTLVQILALWRMFVDGADLVIGTAQNLDVAEESWTGAVEMAEGSPELAAEIVAVDRTNGKKQLRLTRGNRYKVQAASRRGGRGLSGDLVILDELREHQTWEAWAAVTKTTMARQRPQIVCLSNAGDAASIVLESVRSSALEQLEQGTSLGLFEWSAPEGCDLDDRSAWAQGNPALGHTIQVEAIEAALSTDPEAVFRTEVLCQWVAASRSVIDLSTWLGLVLADDEDDELVGEVTFAIDVAPDRSWSSIGVAGRLANRTPHVSIAERAPGTAWIVDRVVELKKEWRPKHVVVDPGSAAGSLIDELERRKVKVTKVTAREYAAACGLFYDAATDTGLLRHDGDPDLSAAVVHATKRTLADAWAWNRRAPGDDITALVAVTLAFGSLTNVRPRKTDAELLRGLG
jgi:phage terminase large subunit-like protein